MAAAVGTDLSDLLFKLAGSDHDLAADSVLHVLYGWTQVLERQELVFVRGGVQGVLVVTSRRLVALLCPFKSTEKTRKS